MPYWALVIVYVNGINFGSVGVIESKYCVVRMRSFLGSLCIPYGFTLSESILDLSATYAFSFKSDLLISVIDFVVFFFLI